MFLIVHATAGAALGQLMPTPLSAFTGGFLSHLVLDMIPHGDEIIGRTFSKKGGTKWLAALAIFDALAAFSVVTMLWLGGAFPNPYTAFVGALGAVLPDVLCGISELSHRKLWPDFVNFHNRNHELLNAPVSTRVGFTGQVITLVGLLWILL